MRVEGLSVVPEIEMSESIEIGTDITGETLINTPWLYLRTLIYLGKLIRELFEVVLCRIT